MRQIEPTMPQKEAAPAPIAAPAKSSTGAVLPRIVIEAVPQHAMRPPYDQDMSGDWLYEGRDLVIRATGTDLSDPETFLLALHELIEAYLCRHRGITQAQVDRFDEAMARVPLNPDYPHDPDAEPGDHPASPYRREHRFSCLIEFMVAHEIGLVDYGVIR